jgi:hypothetical protein
MSYSGHKSLESFRIYLHASSHGCIVTDQCIESVGLFLASFAGMKGTEEHREPVMKLLNLWKSRRLRYHGGPIKNPARLAQW